MRKKGLHAEDLVELPDGDGWLLVQFGGQDQAEADAKARALIEDLAGEDGPSAKLLDDPAEREDLWEIRESGLGATARVPGENDTWPGWEDSAVPPDRVGDYLRDLRALFDQYGYSASVYGHFGQGGIHCRIDFDVRTADGIAHWRRFLDDAADLVVSYGGSFSGEHGDGQARGELLEKMYGPELVQAFREFKGIWDPQGRMNPGKAVDAAPITANLRLGTDYRPPEPATHFAFPDDGGSLPRATLRCVGVGKCRRDDAGVMCPSYMVTHEGQHSTRARARLLFEMLQGDVVKEGWRDDAVKESLDLCLACKGCKNECPVNVDMATYKAEFLSHYYSGRLRPVQAYSIGLIYWWSRIASRMPRLVNAVTRRPRLAAVIKRLGGVAQERPIPTFSEKPFTTWFREREERNLGAPDVLLWPDTFNNFLHADTARAMVEVLEAAGRHVVIPERPLCCGRPLYDYGMLPTAKRLLRQTLDNLRPHIAAGTPMVGIEPSCLAVFRDELTQMFPNDWDARRLASQSLTLAEYLTKHCPDFSYPQINRTAIVQAHCHHRSIMHFHAEEVVMDRLGLDWEVLESGCCGVAGSFGFEAGEKYEVSVKAGERVLLPAVRDADDDTLVLADGFSCQAQIADSTRRDGVHLAEVIAAGLRG
jgi:Fe-S oxidoreductase